MSKILIVGAGYAGFYTAWKLDQKLRPGEAQFTVVDLRPYMKYQPFLPEVIAGSIEPLHAAEAEDIVQYVWLRWQVTDRSVVLDPPAFLATTTTRSAINLAQSAPLRHETYVGP